MTSIDFGSAMGLARETPSDHSVEDCYSGFSNDAYSGCRGSRLTRELAQLLANGREECEAEGQGWWKATALPGVDFVGDFVGTFNGLERFLFKYLHIHRRRSNSCIRLGRPY